MYRMIRTSHEANKYFGTVQNPPFAISSRISSPEGAMTVFKIKVRDRFPDVMHLVGRQRNLMRSISQGIKSFGTSQLTKFG
jgi:hypothetical protein